MRYNSTKKAQTAIDFLVSYGIVILVVGIAMYVTLRLGIFNVSLAPASCTSAPSFVCDASSMSKNGIATFVITQALGGSLTLTGAACSSQLNGTGSGPQYGNTKVQSYSVASQYYPNNALINPGASISSGSNYALVIYCYGPYGIATGNLGNSFQGFLWLNYTYGGLPSTYHSVQRIIQFTTYYT